MKTSRLLLVAFVLVLGGCFAVPAPYADRLDPIAKRYAAVKAGATMAEAVAILGQPSRRDDEGAQVWETQIDDLNYVRLRAWFADNQSASKIELTRAHGIRSPGYQANAVSSWTK